MFSSLYQKMHKSPRDKRHELGANHIAEIVRLYTDFAEPTAPPSSTAPQVKEGQALRAQVTLTPSEAKRIIAKAITALPEVQTALREGRVLLKGGTTVSAVAEELCGNPLRISGRISSLGTKCSASTNGTAPHSLLIDRGELRNVDRCLEDVVPLLTGTDVAVLGANAIDVNGNAAMMAGAPLGGPPGRILSGLLAQGSQTIIAAGLEKLIPGRIEDAVRAAGRAGTQMAMGMAVGLIPLIGRLITEREALEILAEVRSTVIGAGGIFGGEGATTLVIEGQPDSVVRAFRLAESVKGATLSGVEDSFPECQPGSTICRQHPGCVYFNPS
jgi:hypothetical protein